MEITIEQLYSELQGLRREFDALKSDSTIPYDIDQAFKSRLQSLFGEKLSSKAASSENKSVDEAGMATYSVLLPPDGFTEETIAGTKIFKPYYT